MNQYRVAIPEPALHGHPEALAERFGLVVRATNDGIWDWDLRTDDVYFSPRWKEMLGYAEDEIPHRFEEWERRIHPEDRERALATIRAHLAGTTPVYELEHRLQHRDGGYRWIRARGATLRDADGVPYRMAGSHMDITAQKRADAERAESGRALSTLLGNLPGMAYRCRNDPAWTMELVSDGCVDLTGYLPADLVASRRIAFADLIHPDDREMVWRDVQVALAARRAFRLTYRIRTAGGAEKWVWEQGCGVVAGDGRLTAIEGFITDVTERVEAHQRLERQVAERTAALRAAHEATAHQLDRLATLAGITAQLLAAPDLDGVLGVVVGAAGRLCAASGAMVGLIDDDQTHITAVAAAGEPRAYFEHFQRPTLDADFFTGTATGRALTRRCAVAVEDYRTWGGGHHLRTETMRLGVLAFVVAPLLVDGAPIGVLWVNDTKSRPFAAEDISLVQALADQAALAIQHARLLRRSHDAAALEERARLARDLHDSVTQSVFSVGLMAGAAQLQLERGRPELGETLAKIRTVAGDALSEMRALLFELHPAALAEEGVAKALAKLVAAMQVRVAVPIRYTGTSDARLGTEAETAIFRIVQEALGNAAKHAEASELRVTLAEHDGCLVVEVADDGAGFDPTATVIPSADGRRGGMGLSSMRERAAAAGLTLHVTSAPGLGTRVLVEAPFP